MVDAVLSYHMNPATCGVAKFNQQLAQRLGVPVWSLGLPLGRGEDSRCPLVSVKFSELEETALSRSFWPTWDVFCHDTPRTQSEHELVSGARRVYAANPAIARTIRQRHKYASVIEAFCPSTIQGNASRAALNVLTFGMASKLTSPHYEKLKQLLDGTGQDYTVCVSTAVHEGSPWEAVSEAGDRLRTIFGSHTRVLGYLADDALAKELQDCSAVAMFFEPALRANNTTFWSAYDEWLPVITNLDADSPVVDHGVYDITALGQWPEYVRLNRYHRAKSYTWERLLSLLQ